MTEPTVRVCPRCGSEAHEQEYCQTCGLHLTQQAELPTRAQWEESQADDARRKQGSLTSVLRQWLAGRRRGGIALVATACVAIVGIALVAATVGGGDSAIAKPVLGYLDAIADGDGEEACTHLAKQYANRVDSDTYDGDCPERVTKASQEYEAGAVEALRDAEIERVETPEGREPIVYVRFGRPIGSDEFGAWNVVKEEGEWKIGSYNARRDPDGT